VAQLTEEHASYIRDNAYYGVLTTLRADGSPHSTVVWVDVDANGNAGFNTAEGRAKPNHIERDPRVSLTVVNPSNGYQWVCVTGTASMTTEGADAQIDRLAKKYLDADSYPFRKEGEVRLSVPIAAERIEAHGFGEE
jgi:PPOX class probable F420-dependent enzyme